MKTLIISLMFVAMTANLRAQTTGWEFDTKHTKIAFSVAHMMISETEGSFGKYSGSVLSDKADFSDAAIKFTIDVASIDTDEPDRDKHLRSPDFFDTEKYPEIKFESTSMKSLGKNKYVLKGKLTMKNKELPVELDVKFNGTRMDPWGNTKAGFTLSGVIDRTKWGLEYNSILDGGGVVIGDEVNILCRIELKKM